MTGLGDAVDKHSSLPIFSTHAKSKIVKAGMPDVQNLKMYTVRDYERKYTVAEMISALSI